MSFILIFHSWRGLCLFISGIYGVQLGFVTFLFSDSDTVGVFKPRKA